MLYHSTRDKSVQKKSAETIVQGLSFDGGLFVPETVPAINENYINELVDMRYPNRVVEVLKLFCDDFSNDELSLFAERAYGGKKFGHEDVAPVQKAGGAYFLELWHGPTCAFKDFALQILPELLTASMAKTDEKRDVCILVATSGDTGKAALEGFCDVARTKILVFYPRDGVSEVQKLQMVTQTGDNVSVVSVNGNFDDAQTGVKVIFSDTDLRERLNKKGVFLSSANSINCGRFIPQIAYYFSAYCDLIKTGEIKAGDKINFCVPTGNFGNILAGYYAMKMGLPINKLICASNENDVLTEFISTGVYNRNRTFYTTSSPSMDILVSSNLERLVYELSGKDDALIRSYMKALSEDGIYEVSDSIKKNIAEIFDCGSTDETETKRTIKALFESENYLIDTHTAVAHNVLKKYREKTGDMTKTVVVSTASPYKFCDQVLEALGHNSNGLSAAQLIEKLEEVTKTSAPVPLSALNTKKVRFTDAVEKDGTLAAVEAFI